MLVTLSQVLETPVSALLGETVVESQPDDLKVIAEKLELINLQFVRRKETRRRFLHWSFIAVCALISATYLALFILGSPYLDFDYSDPEWSVVGTMLHGFEWIFVRAAPFAFFASLAGAIVTRNRQ